MLNLFNKNKSISISAPMTGDIVEITQVEDEVFSEKMVGDGVGDRVEIGDKLLEVNLDFIKKSGKSIISPIIITNMDIVKNISTKTGNVIRGKDSIMHIVI